MPTLDKNCEKKKELWKYQRHARDFFSFFLKIILAAAETTRLENNFPGFFSRRNGTFPGDFFLGNSRLQIDATSTSDGRTDGQAFLAWPFTFSQNFNQFQFQIFHVAEVFLILVHVLDESRALKEFTWGVVLETPSSPPSLSSFPPDDRDDEHLEEEGGRRDEAQDGEEGQGVHDQGTALVLLVVAAVTTVMAIAWVVAIALTEMPPMGYLTPEL